MTDEQLPELHKGEAVFWAGDQDSKKAAHDKEDINTEALQGIAQLSRKELAVLAAQLAISSDSKVLGSKPPEEGSDTYLG